MPAREGKYSNIKNPKICSWLVNIVIPVSNNIMPLTFVMIAVYLRIFFEKNKNLLIKTPDIINGSAKPSE